jgi:hypothetical protein
MNVFILLSTSLSTWAPMDCAKSTVRQAVSANGVFKCSSLELLRMDAYG